MDLVHERTLLGHILHHADHAPKDFEFPAHRRQFVSEIHGVCDVDFGGCTLGRFEGLVGRLSTDGTTPKNGDDGQETHTDSLLYPEEKDPRDDFSTSFHRLFIEIS